jgi:hypothetical protein
MNKLVYVSSVIAALAVGGTAIAKNPKPDKVDKAEKAETKIDKEKKNVVFKGTDEKHKEPPVEQIRDTWTPDLEHIKTMMALAKDDPIAIGRPPEATLVVDKDGSYTFSGKWESSPCMIHKVLDRDGHCRLQLVMGIKGGEHDAWANFREDSGELKKGANQGVTWDKHGQSKELAEHFAELSSKGHEWTVSFRILWKEIEPPSHSFWDDILDVVKDVGKGLGVVGPIIAAL